MAPVFLAHAVGLGLSEFHAIGLPAKIRFTRSAIRCRRLVIAGMTSRCFAVVKSHFLITRHAAASGLYDGALTGSAGKPLRMVDSVVLESGNIQGFEAMPSVRRARHKIVEPSEHYLFA